MRTKLQEYTERHKLERFKVVIEFDADTGFWIVTPIVWRGAPLARYVRNRDAWRALRQLNFHAATDDKSVWQYSPRIDAISWPYIPTQEALS